MLSIVPWIVAGSTAASVPIHVVVDHVPLSAPGPAAGEQTIWLAVSGVASTIAALVTGTLAFFTYRLAKVTSALAEDTVVASRLADRHHQEALQPLVRVEGELTIRHIVGPSGEPNEYLIVLDGEVVNVGGGPATSINILVKPDSYVERSFYLGMLGANSTRILRGVQWRVSRTQHHPNMALWPFHLQVRYQSIFGSEGTTEQYSHSGQRTDLIDSHYMAPRVVDRPLPDAARADGTLSRN